MISGYVHGIKDRYRDEKGYFYYFKKYLTDIYLPYIVFSYIGWAMSMIFFASGSNSINFNSAGLNEFFTIPYKGFRLYWFLLVLFIIKIIHTGFEYNFRNVIYNAVFWVIVFIAVSYAKKYIRHLSLYENGFSCGIYFHLGYLFRRKGCISQNNNPGILWGVVLFTAGTALFLIPYIGRNSNIFTKTISTSGICIGLFVMFYALRIKNKFLVSCGIDSMVIYLVHDYIVFAVTMMFKTSGIFRDTGFAAFILCSVIALAASVLVIKLYRD